MEESDLVCKPIVPGCKLCRDERRSQGGWNTIQTNGSETHLRASAPCHKSNIGQNPDIEPKGLTNKFQT